jgi:4-amino-4-deoxy-L-arabinose transferase-like glycosyltransferase
MALMAFTLVVRSGFLLFAHHNFQADPDGYHRLANNLVHQGTLGDQVPIVRQQADGTWQVTRDFCPTAYRPPLYPLLLAAIVHSGVKFKFVMALLHLALGLFTVWLTVGVGIQLGLGRATLLAGALVACDPILLHQSSLVMTETLAALLAVMAIGCLIRCTASDLGSSSLRIGMRFALAGGVLALAALCRPTFLLMLPLAGTWLWFQLPKSSGRSKAAVGFLLSAMLVLAPWIARNIFIFGKPIVATTHGGYTFHLANNPGFYHYLRTADWGTVWNSTDNFRLYTGSDITLNMIDYPESRLVEVASNLNVEKKALPVEEPQQELLLDKLHYSDAMWAIRDEPTMFAYSIAVRLGRLWQPLPHRAAVSNRLLHGNGTLREAADTVPESLRSWFARYVVAFWYVGVYLLAVMGLWSLGWKLCRTPWCWGMLLVVSFMALHALYWTDMRMRAPLVPVVCWWAAAGWNCYHSSRSARKA